MFMYQETHRREDSLWRTNRYHADWADSNSVWALSLRIRTYCSKPRLGRLEQRLGIVFEDKNLLLQAMTHSSYINEVGGTGIEDNQRLEFLGDAALDCIVGEWLYRRYPSAREGQLTSLRAHIVRTEGLATLARELELGQCLIMGHGEAMTGGDRRQANLCAAFEAVVGAIYLDQGMDILAAFVNGLLAERTDEIDARLSRKDAKSRLQEMTQAHLRVTPCYRITDAVGPDHARLFTAEVAVDGVVWGKGQGRSKQMAEQQAAADALSSHTETVTLA